MKYYMADGSEYVYGRDWYKDVAADQGKPVVVELCKREKGGEMMWCSASGEFCCPSEECGSRCEDYNPCNKVSGRCRELKQGFIGTGKWYRITERGQVRRIKK